MSIISKLSSIDKINKKYKEGEFSFPAQEKMPPKYKETSDYCLNICRSAYTMLVRNKTSVPMEWYSYIQVLRDYMSGSQSQTFYDNMIKRYGSDKRTPVTDSQGNPDAVRKGMENISSKIVSIATNLMNAIHGMYDQYDQDIYINSIDNDSGAEEEKAMFDAMFDAKLAPVSNSLQEMYGLPVGGESLLPQDVTLEQMKVYKETGGFKTFWAESMEEAIKHTFQISNWDNVIKKKYINDVVTLNFIAGRTVFCPKTNQEKVEYLDPANTFIQYSPDNMFEDAEYGGYLTLEKIGTLVELGFDSDQLIKAGAKYKDYFDNIYIDDWGRYERNGLVDSRLKELKIPVFHYYWIEVDQYLNKKVTNKYGVYKIHKKDIDKKIDDLSKERIAEGYTQEVYPTRLKQTYQCSWVVDTDMVYNYGRVQNQTKKGREAEIPIKVWRGEATNPKMIFGSIAESILPFLDHLQLAWEKYQDELSKYHSGGYEINLRLLSNLKINGQPLSEYQAYTMFLDTRVLPYMDTPIGETYSGGDVKPIKRIEGSGVEGIQMFQNEINFITNLIERVTGINPVTMGNTEEGVTATATSIASVGTDNVLKSKINGIYEVKEKLASYLTRRLPLLFRNNKGAVESYSKVIGKESVEVIKDAERLGAEYGLTMEARPSEQDIKDMMEMLNIAIQRGRDGEASINIGQAMYIKERIKSGGNFKKLQRQVDFMVRKQDEEMFKKKRALIQEQSQQQAAQSKAASEADMQTKMMDLK